VATNDVTVEGLNTTSTANFPAGSGTGTIREVTAWTQITQILETGTEGGEQQFVTYSFLEDSAEHQIPTVKTPTVFKFTIGDDASLAHYSCWPRPTPTACSACCACCCPRARRSICRRT
jgi:hypothetical protein